MTLKEQIDQDLKSAMLSGDKERVSVLRTVKSAILNVEVAKGRREQGLSDDEIIDVLGKEAKKRQESADMYAQGGDDARSAAEAAEKRVIEQYLPAQLSEEELSVLIDSVITETGASGPQAMGAVIGAVKTQSKGAADGALIARLVKERLT